MVFFKIIIHHQLTVHRFPRCLSGKESAWQCLPMQVGSLVQERSPGGGNGNPLKYSCLENSMDGGAWRAIVHGITKSWTRPRD